MAYIISMILLLVFYVFVLVNMKHMKNTSLYNYIFSIPVIACYLHVVIKVYC